MFKRVAFCLTFILVMSVVGACSVITGQGTVVNVDNSIVTVRGSDGTETTGLVVGDGSQVATIWDFEYSHPDKFQVVTSAGSYESTMQGFDSRAALLLLSVEGLNLPAAVFGKLTLVNPERQLDAAVTGPNGTVLHGEITAIGGPYIRLPIFWAPVNPGDRPRIRTGAVAFDEKGLVLGIAGVDYSDLLPHGSIGGFLSYPVVTPDLIEELLFGGGGHANGPSSSSSPGTIGALPAPPAVSSTTTTPFPKPWPAPKATWARRCRWIRTCGPWTSGRPKTVRR